MGESWFEKHLNITYLIGHFVTNILFIIIDFAVISIVGKIFVYGLILFFCQIVVLLFIAGWVLKKKEQSLFHLLWYLIPIVGVVVILLLSNKRTGQHLEDSFTKYKNKWIVLMTVFSIIFILSFLFLAWNLFLNTKICSVMIFQDAKNKCYLNLGIEINDLNICEKVSEQEYRDICYFRIAVYRKDSSICETISDKIQNISVKSYCYAIIAIDKNDSFICQNLLTQEEKVVCYGIINKSLTISECNQMINAQNKNLCYQFVAIKERDLTICDNIVDTYYEIITKDSCYSIVIQLLREKNR